jgi:hypothetical protein
LGSSALTAATAPGFIERRQRNRRFDATPWRWATEEIVFTGSANLLDTRQFLLRRPTLLPGRPRDHLDLLILFRHTLILKGIFAPSCLRQMFARNRGQFTQQFRIDDQAWIWHGSGWSVSTRMATLPFLLLAVWSHAWLGG